MNKILGRPVAYLKSLSFQKYVNAIIVGVGLLANIISLAQFFSVINVSPSASNFYINSREFLAWMLIATVYSVGLINAVIRRRWRKKYSDGIGDNSIKNLFAWVQIESLSFESKASKRARSNWNNFKRDFSFLYIFLFWFVFLFSRALTATETSTGITASPWGDLFLTFLNTTWVTLIMMMVTSMFDFSLSMFLGEENRTED